MRCITIEKDDEQGKDRYAMQNVRILADQTVVDTEGNAHAEKADHNPMNLFDIEGIRFGTGKGVTGTEDVQHPDGTDHQNKDKQCPVEV